MKLNEQLSELRGLPVTELRQPAKDLYDQVFRLRLQRSLGQAQSGNKVRPLRKTLARVKTVLREKGVKD
jgi:large subunit ribosomal protein L29